MYHVYVCMYVCTMCMYVCMYVPCVCMYVCMYHVYVCMYVPCVCMYVCMYVCTMCMYVCMYVYIFSSSSVLVDGKLLHVSCSQKGKLLLLIALPAEL